MELHIYPVLRQTNQVSNTYSAVSLCSYENHVHSGQNYCGNISPEKFHKWFRSLLLLLRLQFLMIMGAWMRERHCSWHTISQTKRQFQSQHCGIVIRQCNGLSSKKLKPTYCQCEALTCNWRVFDGHSNPGFKWPCKLFFFRESLKHKVCGHWRKQKIKLPKNVKNSLVGWSMQPGPAYLMT